jgi:two-component system, OmpR family, osmolarity sensor histidine kinase EnvZ
MRLVPQSLFARLTLLLIAAVVVAVVSFGFLFRQDRVTLVERNFTDAKVQQIEALREALLKLPDDRGPTVQPLSREYRVILVPFDRRPEIGQVPGPAFRRIVARLQEQIGRDTEIRWGMRLDQAIVWIRMQVTADKTKFVWAGFAMKNADVDEALPARLAMALGGVLVALLAVAFWFARRLTRPLSELSNAVAVVAEGKHPTPLPEDGPSEIAQVAKNINKMASNLAQLETDRKTMLAGISHDIRTPLTRLRLASEISVVDTKQRGDMIADINEIDRIVNQFLDFARGEPSDTPVRTRVSEAIAHVLARAQASGHDVARIREDAAIDALEIDVYPAAFERIFANLIENAHRYGKPPVELSVVRDATTIEFNVIDQGEGVAAEDAERLKQPFVRGDAARGGTMGAGLGLAIVERLVKWHNGHFDIARRAGGGNVARVRLPLH